MLASDVQLPEPLRFLLDLLGFVPDLLGLALQLLGSFQDQLAVSLILLGFFLDFFGFALDLFRSPLAVLNPLLADGDTPLDQGELSLVIGIASPIQRRAQVARCMTHLR